jgi:CDP-diacylglycerol---glycerol-3-phosphate 3-phosphatidyltransferase
MLKLTYIPSMLVGWRVAIAPLLLLDALDRQTGNWFMMECSCSNQFTKENDN